MIEHAKRVFWLGTKVDGGKQTQKEVLESVAQQTGQDVGNLLAIPDCPPAVRHIFDWFSELKVGPERISFGEIESWARLMHRWPTPKEIEVLFRLDHELQKLMTI